MGSPIGAIFCTVTRVLGSGHYQQSAAQDSLAADRRNESALSDRKLL